MAFAPISSVIPLATLVAERALLLPSGILAMLHGDCASTIEQLEIARSARPDEPEIEEAIRSCRVRLRR